MPTLGTQVSRSVAARGAAASASLTVRIGAYNGGHIDPFVAA